MRYLPLFIDTRGRKAVVLGGGRAASIKVKTLLKTDLTVAVYAREICEEIRALACDRLTLHPGWEAGDDRVIDGADLLVIAFDGPEADAILEKARQKQLFALRCDCPEAGDFHLGMSFQKDSLTVAAHTGGLGPMVGREIVKTLQTAVDEMDTERLMLLGSLRRKLIDGGLHGEALTAKMTELFDRSAEELRAMEESYEY